MKRIAYIYLSVLCLVMVSSCMKTKIANSQSANEPASNNEISNQDMDNATVTNSQSANEPASNNEISNQDMDNATVTDSPSVNVPASNNEISNQDMDTAGEWAGFGIPLNILSFQPDTSPLPDVKPWLEKANAGNDEAQFVLSMLYRDGVMGVDNIVNGKPSVKKANRLHEMYRWILREDEDEYEDEESVFMGISLNPSLTDDPEDYHGVHKYDNNETCAAQAESLKLLENIANHGYSNAEFVLGLIYWNGVCVPKDKARGADLIQRAAMHDRKNVNAAYYVGMMHELGIGREVNKKLANAWLELAADNGSVEAQFVMALKYLDGIDVAPDKQKADHYMNMS
ncbi:MAG: SEL1-like repeat protein, partial [Proteobacteria bacterium]|nr:SEL1-like repeat protein [Pseudomonadota bacterium]